MMRALCCVAFAGFSCAASAQLPVDSKPPAIFIIGDSTARNIDQRGWGDPFAGYFDPSKVSVVNRALAGRSSRTFFTGGSWDTARSELKPGDYVLIQFGHNDGGPPDKDRARGSLPGIGDESYEFTMAGETHEVVYTFGWYMRKFISDARGKGAIPIVLSPTVRNIWKDGKVEQGPGSYRQWSADVAVAERVAFVDVTAAIADRYEQMGEEKVKDLFPEDHTHTSQKGAELNASLVVAGLKVLKDGVLDNCLSAKGRALEPYPTPGMQSHGPLQLPRHLPEPAESGLPNLFLIGDSTVRNGRGDGANGQWGWGEPVAGYFDPKKINVVNRAVGGLSSRTYLTFGYWDQILSMLKPGDIVMMQFGHNDSGPLDDDQRARGTLKGTGDETREIDNPITRSHEIVHTYGWHLKQFIVGARAKGATPIVCSPVPRKNWKDGKIARNSEDYAKWAAEIAASEGAAFVDLNEIIARRYDELGPEKVDALFHGDNTHTSRAGAELNAECVIAGSLGLKEDPLAPFFSDKAKAVAR